MSKWYITLSNMQPLLKTSLLISASRC